MTMLSSHLQVGGATPCPTLVLIIPTHLALLPYTIVNNYNAHLFAEPEQPLYDDVQENQGESSAQVGESLGPSLSVSV